MDETQRRPFTEKANADKVRFETENKKYQAKVKRRANAAKKKAALRAAAGLPPLNDNDPALTGNTAGAMKINTPAKGGAKAKAGTKTTTKKSPAKGKAAAKPKVKTASGAAKGKTAPKTADAAKGNSKKAVTKKKPAAKPRQKKPGASKSQQQFQNTGLHGGFNQSMFNTGMDNNYQQSYQDYSQQFQTQPQYQQQQYQQQDYSNYNTSDHVYYNNQIHNWKNWAQVRKGDWGMVYVCGGPLQGHFVYYEDDQGSDQAIVNIGGPMTPPTYAVNLSELRKPPPVHAQLPQQQQHNPMLPF